MNWLTMKRATIGFLFCAFAVVMSAQSATQDRWVVAWSAVPDSTSRPLEAQTVRQIIRISIGGSNVRIRLSNLNGTAPVTIGPVQIAKHASGSAIRPNTAHVVTFAGKPEVTIAKGADVLSDPIAIPVAALEQLVVSMYLPNRVEVSTVHNDGRQTAFISVSGDVTSTVKFPAGEVSSKRFFLTDVEVAAGNESNAIVIVGDSTVDGNRSTQDLNARWTDALAMRLQADPKLASIAVINSGVSGNRLLNDGPVGTSVLSRYDRDVLGKPGVRWVLLQVGINDIGLADEPETSTDNVSAEQIIDGMKALVARTHAKGISIWGATLMPYGDAEQPLRYSAAGEAKRQAINAWIRTSGVFDAVVDFDQAIRDPSHPNRIRPGLDSGDHLHPNDAGYNTLATSIDLGLFTQGH